MANDINRVCLFGRLTRDPEVRFTPNNTPIANFSIASNRSYVNAAGEKKENVSFFNCVCWGKRGQVFAQYVKKGNRILIEGRLEQRSWEDKDGNKRSTVEIVVDDFQFIESAQQSQDAESSMSRSIPNNGPEERVVDFSREDHSANASSFSDDDIPF